MALTIADFLKKVHVERYRQSLGVEREPSYYVDGVPMGWHDVLYVGSFVESVFVFEGVPNSLVPSSGSVNCTDASGNQYTVSFDDAVTVVGTQMFESLSNKVDKENISPHLWRVVVTHKEGSLVSSS